METPCDTCGKPTSIHLTEITDGKKKTVALCATCAEREMPGTKMPTKIDQLLMDFVAAHSVQKRKCPWCTQIIEGDEGDLNAHIKVAHPNIEHVAHMIGHPKPPPNEVSYLDGTTKDGAFFKT